LHRSFNSPRIDETETHLDRRTSNEPQEGHLDVVDVARQSSDFDDRPIENQLNEPKTNYIVSASRDPKVLFEHICKVVAVTMTILFIWASMVPAGSRIAPSETHYLAHLGSFGLFGLAWSLAYPRVWSLGMLFFVTTFGFILEAIEIVGHGHSFEVYDAIDDSVGAAAGVATSRLLRYFAGSWTNRPKSS